MPAISWIDYLNGKKNIHKLNSNEKSDLYRRIRRYARRYLERLKLIAENMEKVTDKPGKQFEQIFYNETGIKCLQAMALALHESRRYAVERGRPVRYVDTIHDLTKEKRGG